MLYKKVHRQFIRQFWKGRKFKFNDGDIEVYEIIDEPVIDRDFVWVDGMNLISLYSGRLLHKDYITWLS